jgi:quercetin 2,3-dioxygenase
MLEPRPSELHGVTLTSRLRSVHHFSFASFMNESRSGWGPLKTLNHIVMPAGVELGPNPIDNVDLIRIVRRGVLGSFGTVGLGLRTLQDEVEVISVGSGIVLGDRNLSRSDLEYVELRLATSSRLDRPSRVVTRFPDRKQLGEFIVLASGYPHDRRALPLQSAARVSACRVRTGQCITQPIARGTKAYLMMLSGQGVANRHLLKSGDGLAIADENALIFTAHRGAELLLIEAPDDPILPAAA